MKINSFTIKNYRSITEAYKIHLDDKFTVLIGRNNEGKSNVLRALSGTFYIIALLNRIPMDSVPDYILANSRSLRLRRSIDSRWDYVWTRDFPISKQGNRKAQQTVFDLEFKLSKEEQDLFHRRIGHHFNEILPFRIIIDKTSVRFEIPKRAYGGKGKAFINKINEICKFISERLDSIFIPSTRPADTTINVVNSILSRRITAIAEKEPLYQKALAVINKIHSREIKKLERELKETISIFIANINNIEIISTSTKYKEKGAIEEIKIDDTVKTSIYEKGEGLQSLISLGVMQKAKNTYAEITLAIDEPESHLHPEAIRKIKNSLVKIGDKGQVIIATHSPILINRDNIHANIIVSENKASPAKTISDIRRVLGVAVSDNLVNAEYVLLVEGPTDDKILRTILSYLSPSIKIALSSGRLVIKAITGAKNICSEKSWLNTFICTGVICYLDYDSAAKTAVADAKSKSIIVDSEVIYSKITGKIESEIEDTLQESVYEEFLPTEQPEWKKFINNKNKKWSDNVQELYDHSGKDFNINSIKELIATKILKLQDPTSALHPDRSSTIKYLQAAIENMMKTKQ